MFGAVDDAERRGGRSHAERWKRDLPHLPLFPDFAPADRCAIVIAEPCGVRDQPAYGASQHSKNGSIARQRGCDSPAAARARRKRSASTHLRKQVRTHWSTRHRGGPTKPSGRAIFRTAFLWKRKNLGVGVDWEGRINTKLRSLTWKYPCGKVIGQEWRSKHATPLHYLRKSILSGISASVPGFLTYRQ